MAIKIKPYDVAEYLDSREMVAEYLKAAFETNDAALIKCAMGDVARAQGITEMAKEAGIARRTLYNVISDEGDPRLSTFLGVLDAFGVSLSTAGPAKAGQPDEIP